MVRYRTMAAIYQDQVELERIMKQEAQEQAGCNIIAMAYRNNWSKEDLITTLQALGLDDGWIGEKIEAGTRIET